MSVRVVAAPLPASAVVDAPKDRYHHQMPVIAAAMDETFQPVSYLIIDADRVFVNINYYCFI